MSADTSASSIWELLSEPIHGPVPDGMPAWKDNAYIAFWDPSSEVFGAAHVSTSPNAEGRRARFSISRGPTMSAYDEFVPVITGDGDRGFAMVEHGSVRNLF